MCRAASNGWCFQVNDECAVLVMGKDTLCPSSDFSHPDISFLAMDAHVVAFKVTVRNMYVKFLSPTKMSESNFFFGRLCQDLDRWRIVHQDRTRVMCISLVNLVNFSCFVCEVKHDFFGVSPGWAGRQVLLQDRSEQCRVCFCPWSRSLPA